MLTADYLRSILAYNRRTGDFQWRELRKGVKRDAARAGSLDKHGHRQLRIDGKLYFAHRLAFLYVTGDWPATGIDHRNGVRADNRWSNLREANQTINMQNRHGPQSNNKSGFLGVHYDKRAGKWHPQIKVGNLRPWLGQYDTAEEAHAAYLAAKRKLHEGCTL